MNSNKYKFDRHLLYLSESDDIEIAKTEWEFICKRTEQDGHCICQHKIKHVTYMYNEKTNYTITVGTDCAEKFNVDISKPVSEELQYILSDLINSGLYEIIDNIVEYSEDVEQKLIDYYKEQISLCNSDSDLNQIVHKLDGLIKKYKLDYLTDVIKYAGKKSLQIK